MPVVVVPTLLDPATDACAEMWADPADVAGLIMSTCEACQEGGITADEATAATIEATYVLWNLSGGKFHGYQCWTEDYLLSPGQPKFNFLKGPVDEILSIETMTGSSISGDSAPLDGWTWDGSYVHLADCMSGETPWTKLCNTCTNVKVRVRYRIKPNLAVGADRATKTLATEFWKARAGQKCSLPDRITSVTRQGVSWTVLDPQDFLSYGRVGIGPIDGWLAVVHRQGGTRVRDPLYEPTVVYSQQTGCGADCS